MSLFSELPLDAGTDEQITQIAVSNVSINPSLAIITPHKILLFNECGEKHDYELSRNIRCTYVQWHPSQPIIALGWETGAITLWSEETKVAKEEPNGHKSEICLIQFNPSGSRMVSADVDGNVTVWRGINIVSQYKKEQSITHAIFCELNIDSKLKSGNLFFFGGKSGVVCLADDANHCSDVCKVGGSIKSLLFYEKENSVIIITSTLLLVMFKISTSVKTGPSKRVKLSIAGDPQKLQSIWIGSCLLATCSHENMLRMWHLDQDDNYVLTLHQLAQQTQTQQGAATVIQSTNINDQITCIQYEKRGKVLVSGTREGRIIFWKNLSIGSESPLDVDEWKMLPYITVRQGVNSIAVGQNNGLIAVQYGNQISLVQETVINGKMTDQVRLLQSSANTIKIYINSDISNQVLHFQSKGNIKGLDCNDQFMLFWTSKTIEIHEIIVNPKESQTKLVASIQEKCLRSVIHKENIILVNDIELNVLNFKGIQKQNLKFSESEGKILNVNVLNNHLIMWTSNNYIRLFDISRREVKQIGVTRRFENSQGQLGQIRHCAVNSDGSKIVITADQRGKLGPQADNKFYIYDVQTDNFLVYEMPAKCIPLQPYCDRKDRKFFGISCIINKNVQEEKNADENNDENDDNKSNKSKNDDDEEKDNSNLEFYTFFVTSENGIKKQDQYQLESSIEAVFAIDIPKLYFIKRNKKNNSSGQNYKIVEKYLNDFVGLEKIDNQIKEAIMNFSFYLTMDNLDEAYKSVKQIQNPSIWEKMAQMCVKTKRIDVAEICLGNMRFARGSKAIREQKKEPELDAQLAMVAIQLNMKDEAVKLYEQSKRYDLYNKMLQAEGNWEKAIQVSENYDRINLKNTYYRTAQMYEVSNNYEQAIVYYEKSGTHVKEVPRMLLEAGQIDLLDRYIVNKNEKALYKWWAQYQESNYRIEQAVKFYKQSEDYDQMVNFVLQKILYQIIAYLFQVRLFLTKNDVQTASSICSETNNSAACYILAKYLEMNGQIPEAIQYYWKSQHYTQAVRLAREKGMDNEVMSISLQGPNQVKLQSAAYFEEKGFKQKAVELYKKGGNLMKAYNLAQEEKLFDEAKQIARQIEQEEDQRHKKRDPNDLTGIIDDFIEKGQPERAVPLMIKAKQYERAIETCIRFNIPITQDLVDKIIPSEPAKNAAEENKRKELMKLIADTSIKQGDYRLSSKLYTKLGNQIEAMKCLINLGAIDEVVNYATMARMPQLYILAGNFLQTTDWHKNPQLMKHIITFYNKAKAYDNLAGFFDACSSVEIDEYRDYEKAAAALNEALKHAKKSTSESRDFRIEQLETKLNLVQKFVQARALFSSDPQQMKQICEDLLAQPGIDQSVRSGDIYAQIIEYYYQVKNFSQAFDYIKKMQQKRIILAPYLDQEMLQQILESQGVSLNSKNKNNDDEFIEEDVPE
ncbi:hypothetical protein ABPG74_006328 [Tetrahymena malaccensis]